MENQKTICRDIEFTGIALHSGRNVTVRLKPALANTGIIFKRIDLPGKPEIPANLNFVVNTTLCTELGCGKVRIKTVEHFLSALAGLGIDNVIVEVDGCEMPAMDGSSFPFVKEITEAGIREFSIPKKYIKIKKTITLKKNDRIVRFEPSDRIIYSFYLEYDNPIIGNQFFTFRFDRESYISEISQARTFGFLEEVELLRKNNLGLGGSLENAIVIDKDRVLNPEGLRYGDEFVRHKILDAIGDLSLLGYQFIGHFTGIKSGHELNYLLAKALIEDQTAWEFLIDESISNKCNYAIA